MYIIKYPVLQYGLLIEPKGDIITFCKEQIDCQLLERVKPFCWRNTPYCLLVDESGALKKNRELNLCASVIYGSDIYGVAFAVRDDDDDEFKPLNDFDISFMLDKGFLHPQKPVIKA